MVILFNFSSQSISSGLVMLSFVCSLQMKESYRNSVLKYIVYDLFSFNAVCENVILQQ